MWKRCINFMLMLVLSMTLFKGIFISNIHASEIEYKHGLIIPENIVEFWSDHPPKFKIDLGANLANSADWSSNDSPVKNQGGCGSCWAFAAVALIENIGTQSDLAEQVIVSCASGDCGGGWYGDALQYIGNYGIPPEVCYSYTATNGSCGSMCSSPAFLERVSSYDYYGNWGTPTSSTTDNLRYLLQTGPVCVAMRVPEDGTFYSYSGGIYNYEGGYIPSYQGHAVLVVGYNDANQYFKVKNSWGTGWGEGGYFRISYDDVTDDVQFGGYAVTASGAYTDYVVPVELSFFSVEQIGSDVQIEWKTESETNNFGFDVEKSADGSNFSSFEFIRGKGTTTIPSKYSIVDNNLENGKYYYRLKQIDFDGTPHYSNIQEIELRLNDNLFTFQNYPNPFNSETQIKFQLSTPINVKLVIYNMLSREIRTLENNLRMAGDHTVKWDGKDNQGNIVPSGIYYYKFTAGEISETRKLLFLK